MAAFDLGWAAYLTRGAALPPPPPRLLFLDYDSTINPGQGNAPLTEARAELLGATLRAWRAQYSSLQIYVLTASNPEVKTACLAAAGVLDCFHAVLSSTMPKRYESKGAFLRSFLEKAGVSSRDALHADDSHDAIESILSTEGGAACHTLRLPYRGQGLTPKDLQTLAKVFVNRSSSCSTGLWHANSYEHNDVPVLDTNDTPEKCMLDGMDKGTRSEVLLQNRDQAHMQTWLLGRPDFASALASAP